MKQFCLLLAILVSALSVQAASPDYYVDSEGILRDSQGKEASFFGVNYTLPFAHAYRAADYIGFDRRKAIDNDVYHFARLGLNAYRIHIWDVEISDVEGNLVENEHLDLLDYLIYKLSERGIKTLVTAQTNFGNGYPERNTETGGFSYLYDKCRVHTDPAAVAAQERYIAQLVSHVNPYTGHAYKDDPCVVAFEINNEPCHADTPSQTEDYIDSMLAAIEGTGNTKPVFYNVSHNMDHVGAYYNTAIEGTTYQWYPIGLVSGHTRRGNFLPYVDSYDIPFRDTVGFGSKAKAVYEFDPADIMYSYMYPAMVRTFRTAGFQWITQFAYDPTDMAAWNTEYQTHYLNLAYTPSKAISLMIAAQAAYSVPLYKEFGAFPADTLFGDFRVSYRRDLSEMNSPDKFIYSNNTATVPADAGRLELVAGCGSSPIVRYEGTGAYFLDRLDEGVWRLEVMPDAVQVADPFERTSLQRQVTAILWNAWPMTIDLPGLGTGFRVEGINNGNSLSTTVTDRTFTVSPGVYLISAKGKTVKKFKPGYRLGNIEIGEYTAPEGNLSSVKIMHSPAPFAPQGMPYPIEATIAAPSEPDSVVVYTDRVSMWNPRNPSVRLERTEGYEYRGELPAGWIVEGALRYTITVFSDGKATTFPEGAGGAPLDWDFPAGEYYATVGTKHDAPVLLMNAAADTSAAEIYALPRWANAWLSNPPAAPGEAASVKLNLTGEGATMYLRQYVADVVASRRERTAASTHLCIAVANGENISSVEAGFITSDGFTYMAPIAETDGGVVRIPLSALRQTSTTLLPLPYPTFLSTEFVPQTAIPFNIADVETFQLTATGSGTDPSIEIRAVWLE